MPPSPEPPNSDHEKPVVETEPSKPETPNQPNATPKDAPPHDAPPVDPPVADPPPNNPSAGGPPEALKQAYEALQQKNVEQAIALLEKCVADNSPSPYMEEAEELLAQAKTATSDDVAKKVLREWARKLTDKEVQDIADGKPANVKIDVPVQHPILARIFIERTGKHFSSVMLERLNGNIPDVQSGSPPVRRPTDPAVLLATRGLTQEGGRWTLSGMEQELKDQLTKVAALEKKIATARSAVSPRQREAVALARRELAARRALAEKEHQDAIRPGNLIEFRDQEKYEKRIAELQEVEKRLNAAEEKVTQANIAAQAAIEELQPELDLLEEKVKLFEDTYERLTNDEEVLEAIERQGAGSFASSTVLKASQRRAAAIRKALDDGSL